MCSLAQWSWLEAVLTGQWKYGVNDTAGSSHKDPIFSSTRYLWGLIYSSLRSPILHTSIAMCRMKLLIHSQTSKAAPLKFGNGLVIPPPPFSLYNYISMLGSKLKHVENYRSLYKMQKFISACTVYQLWLGIKTLNSSGCFILYLSFPQKKLLTGYTYPKSGPFHIHLLMWL